MRTTTFIIILFLSFNSFGQKKPKVYYNEDGVRITERDFIQTKNYEKNLDVYVENETTLVGRLVTRKKFGHLDKKTFEDLKSYLTELTGKQIDSTRNIVINYLTAHPGNKENATPRSQWDILDDDYAKILHKTDGIEQFWIHSPEIDNLEFYYLDKINWVEDTDGFFEKMFFPYVVKYGNFILIKPDGHYYYYLGEHSKHQIWEQSKKYFK